MPRLFIILLMLAGVTAACGRRAQKVQSLTPSTSNGGSGNVSTDQKNELTALTDPTCPSKKKCPDPTYKLVDSNAEELSMLSGKLNKEVEWHAEITSDAKPGRLKLAMRDIPAWATVSSGKEVGVKIIKGKPNQKTTKSSMTFVIRDMLKCKLNTPESDWADCLDIEHQTDFEKEIQVNFKID